MLVLYQHDKLDFRTLCNCKFIYLRVQIKLLLLSVDFDSSRGILRFSEITLPLRISHLSFNYHIEIIEFIGLY